MAIPSDIAGTLHRMKSDLGAKSITIGVGGDTPDWRWLTLKAIWFLEDEYFYVKQHFCVTGCERKAWAQVMEEFEDEARAKWTAAKKKYAEEGSDGWEADNSGFREGRMGSES